MFGISGFELLIILAVVLIIFGPEKLPELGRTVGRAMATFKRAQEDMERVIRAEMYTSESKKPTPADAGAETAAAAQPAAPTATTTAASIWAATDEADEEDEE